MLKAIKAIYLQLILCISASAATYYVSPVGNNSNKGTSENKPFQVEQFAVNQMTAGD